MIRSFFDGNNYYAFVTTTFLDVRLVGTPPESIGKFGADTDNWVWPRHTGDFSFSEYMPTKTISLQNIPKTMCLSLQNISCPFPWMVWNPEISLWYSDFREGLPNTFLKLR